MENGSRLWAALYRRFKKHQRYFNDVDIGKIKWAFDLAHEVHATTPIRVDGSKYIRHPVAMVYITFAWEIYDTDLIILLLLHDVLEEADNKYAVFLKIVSKLGLAIGVQLLFLTKADVRVLRKLYMPTLKTFGTWRCLLVKFADTLHNLRTLKSLPRDRQEKKVDSVTNYFKDFHDKIKLYMKMGVFDTEKRDAVLRVAQIAYNQIMSEQKKCIRRLNKNGKSQNLTV